eukprot:858852-Alexandrium_andersonii.AAC.1
MGPVLRSCHLPLGGQIGAGGPCVDLIGGPLGLTCGSTDRHSRGMGSSGHRSRPVRAAIRLTPQSALPNMQTCLRRSELEPRGPRNGLEIDPRSFRGVTSTPLSAQTPKMQTKGGTDGVRSRETRELASSNPQSARSLAVGARERPEV